MNHIQSVRDPLLAWCNEPITVTDFHFKSVDQAALNGIFPDKKRTCQQCIQNIVEALLNNIEADND